MAKEGNSNRETVAGTLGSGKAGEVRQTGLRQAGRQLRIRIRTLMALVPLIAQSNTRRQRALGIQLVCAVYAFPPSVARLRCGEGAIVGATTPAASHLAVNTPVSARPPASSIPRERGQARHCKCQRGQGRWRLPAARLEIGSNKRSHAVVAGGWGDAPRYRAPASASFSRVQRRLGLPALAVISLGRYLR